MTQGSSCEQRSTARGSVKSSVPYAALRLYTCYSSLYTLQIAHSKRDLRWFVPLMPMVRQGEMQTQSHFSGLFRSKCARFLFFLPLTTARLATRI